MNQALERFSMNATDFEIVIEKHGTHDQSSHGSWAHGGLSAKEQEVHQRIKDVEVSGYKRSNFEDEFDTTSYQTIKAKYTTADNKTYILKQENTKLNNGKNEVEVKAYVKRDGGLEEIGFLNTKGTTEAVIDSVFVKETYQRQGIATAMLNMARTYAPEKMKISHSFSLTDDAVGWSNVVKHGNHDQSSHGNWAHGGGVGSEVAGSVLERVRANGGLSVNMVNGSEPTSGFMVAKGAKFADKVEAVDFYDPIKGPKILSDFMKRFKSDLATGKNYLGLWHNKEDGKVYLDVSENIQDRERARTLGAKRDQISIWDVANFAEIETGGTGNVEKTGSSSTSRFIDDDRRADRRVRQDNLEQTRKAVRVIRFEAGLKPFLKHLEGQHDQSTHGSWANQGYSEQDAKDISRMSELGPSIDDMNNFINQYDDIDENDLIDFVNNNKNFYDEATDGIDESVAAELISRFPEGDFTEQQKVDVYEQIQAQMISDYVDGNSVGLSEFYRSQNNMDVDTGEFVAKLEEVYSITHRGTNPNGEEITLSSGIQDVEIVSGNMFEVTGTIYDGNGEFAGEWKRDFTKNPDGSWEVEHSFLKLEDEYQGTGFGKKFLADSEAWYISRGFSSIKIGTAWDGARHWARAGFDWNFREMDGNFRELEAMRMNLSHYEDGKYLPEFDKLMGNMVENYDGDFWSWDSVKPITGMPTPAHFASIGYRDKKASTSEATKDTWAGKSAMYGLHMNYRKSLKEADSRDMNTPIDRDGDGVVFDGTPREQMAPTPSAGQ